MLQVTTNGYFSMGQLSYKGTLQLPSLTSPLPLVAPYAADISTVRQGRIRYATFPNGEPEVLRVSKFITRETSGEEGRGGDEFLGTWMAVAEWEDVPIDLQPQLSVGIKNLLLL